VDRRRQRRCALPQYQQITFRTRAIGNARFTPDEGVIYQPAWDGGYATPRHRNRTRGGARDYLIDISTIAVRAPPRSSASASLFD